MPAMRVSGSNRNAVQSPKGVTPMKKLIILLLALSVFAIPSRAQSFDASVSYSYFRLGGSGGFNQNGVSGSLAYNPNRWLGLVGDFGGYHASPGGVSLNTYTYLFGPRLTLRNPTKINPFAQALIGGSRITAGAGSGSSNQFAYSIGGGVDIGLLPHLAFRPQVDYVGLNTPGTHTNCTRVSAGFVVHF
jgi:opacity protein-like surface antigen